MKQASFAVALLVAFSVACDDVPRQRQDSVWSFRTHVPWLAGNSHAFTPVVDGQSVFFCGGYFWDAEDAIHQLALKDGRVVWKHGVGDCRSEPWLVAGTVVVHSKDSRYGPCVFQGFDPATGKVRWRREFQSGVPLTTYKCWLQAAAVAGESIVFAFDGETEVHAVGASGTLERFVIPDEGKRQRVWIAASGPDAWFGVDTRMWRWTARRRQPEDAVSLAQDAASPWYAAASGTRLILAGRAPAFVRAFDLTTGRLEWELTGLPELFAMSADDEFVYLSASHVPLELIVVDAKTGGRLWTGAGGFYSPTKRDGNLYVNGWFSVLVVNPATGAVTRRIAAEAEVITTPVPAGDLLVFGTINGALHAVR